jgi:hypothetical protein
VVLVVVVTFALVLVVGDPLVVVDVVVLVVVEVVDEVAADVVVDVALLQDASSIAATSKRLKPNQITLFFTYYLHYD